VKIPRNASQKLNLFLCFVLFIVLAISVRSLSAQQPSVSTVPATEEESLDDTLPEISQNTSPAETPEKSEPDTYTQPDPPPQTSPAQLPAENTQVEKETLSTNAGSVTSLEASSLDRNSKYTFDLSGYDFSALAVSWSNGSLDYSLGVGQASALHPADDIQEFEKLITSDLIETAATQITLIPNVDIDNVKIDLISPETPESPLTETTLSATGVYNRDAGAQYTSLTTISRDQWGANPASWDPNSSTNIDDPARFVWQPYYHPVSRIVVHHTATENYPSDPAAAVRSIYLYHTYSRKWGDIGYNYLIDHYGNIYEGKAGGDEVYGYHAYTEANAMSVAISMIGNFTSVAPTSSAQSSLVKLMAEKAVLHDFDLKYSNGYLSKWLDTSYTVFGHRDSYFWCYVGHPYFTNPYVCNSREGWAANPTACPGDTLRNLLASSITPQAQDYKNNNFGALKSVVASVEYSASNPHFDDTIIVGFKLPVTASEAQVLALIPKFSGISDITVEKNVATIKVYDWNTDPSATVPPEGWSGYMAPNTFFPAANGTDDRLSTLIKIFRMDPQVSFAEFIGDRDILPVY
jgi:hypothetical protein